MTVKNFVTKVSGRYRVLIDIARKVDGRKTGLFTDEIFCNVAEELAEDVLRVYSSNVKLVEEIGKSIGFDPVFYWQPVIFTKENLSFYEEQRRRNRK